MRVVALGARMLHAGFALVCGSCENFAPAACASAPRSVAVLDLCIAVKGARLDTVRVLLDKVAVLLVQILVCTESRC